MKTEGTESCGDRHLRAAPHELFRWNKTKHEISLSPHAINVINHLLSNGEEVKLDVNPKTHELMIFRVPRKKLEYKVVVAER